MFAVCTMLAACAGPTSGYTINGSIKDAADGQMVYLKVPHGRQLTTIDSASVKGGEFTFKGVQDTASLRYITCILPNAERPLSLPFFLENGEINVSLNQDNETVSGTYHNDIYQSFKDGQKEILTKLGEIQYSLQSGELSEEDREAKIAEFEKLYAEKDQYQINAMHNNINNAMGALILTHSYHSMGTAELHALLQQIPGEYAASSEIVRIKESVNKKMQTEVGQKFIDFSMPTPDGKEAKLSDFIGGKNKLLLVDFWASWCGPCRRAMPELKNIYKEYKNKGLEIVGVSFDRNADAWKQAIKDDELQWKHMSDLKYWQSEAAKLYGVNSIPHLMLIDAEGTIVARGLHGEELANKIAELLK